LPEDSEHLSDAFARMAGILLTEDTLDVVLERVVSLAKQTVPAVTAASVTLHQNGRGRTSNYTDDTALALDHHQYEAERGPCLEAIETNSVVSALLAEQHDRWPGFVEASLACGVQSVLSTPLSVKAEPLGALNLYSNENRLFDDHERSLAAQFAQQAAVVLANTLAYTSATRLNDELRQAVETREVIGQAKGIIMAQRRCTRDEAFDVLRRASQRTNRKLRDIAAELVTSVERSGPAPGDKSVALATSAISDTATATAEQASALGG